MACPANAATRFSKIVTSSTGRHSSCSIKPRGTPCRVALVVTATGPRVTHDSVSQQDFVQAPAAAGVGSERSEQRVGQHPASPSARSTPSRRRTFPNGPPAISPASSSTSICAPPRASRLVRNKLRRDAYREMPRLFVLADALHHGTMQAWALGATDTISRPFDAKGILQRIRAAFPDSDGYDATDRGKVLNRGVEAAHAVMVKIFEKLPAGEPLKFERRRRGREQDPQGHQAFLPARMADRPSAAITPTPIAIACSSPASRWRSRSISACARTTSAVSPAPRCCTMSARPSSRSRSWTSPAS